MSAAQNGESAGSTPGVAEAHGSGKSGTTLYVLLPAAAAHLAPTVLAAGGVPIIDATGDGIDPRVGSAPLGPPELPSVPTGAWVRTRPGRPAPGAGPVVLAELGAPVPDRATWLETGVAREVPPGFAGLVLRGREAGGLCGEEDGLVALARCPDPGRVILDAGLGPATAASAAALGAGGVLLVEQILGCPELSLPAGLERRLRLADDEVTAVVAGIRAAAGPTAPVWRQVAAGEDPWALGAKIWRTGDPTRHLWLVGQGLALARELAERHGAFAGVLAAYGEAIGAWRANLARGRVLPATTVTVGSAAGLSSGAAATTGGTVGSGVLWQEAVWSGRAVHGGPLLAALATGADVVADRAAVDAIRKDHAAPSPVAAVPPAGTGTSMGAPAVAIIGIGCRFPGGSNSPEQYWANIVGKKYAIGEVPKERWDAALFFDADESVPDKTYTKIGGFVTDFVFDGKPFRIPPNVARQVDLVQQLTLVCVADALRDARLKLDKRATDGRDFDRERCAVILGNSVGGEITDRYAIRLAWPDVARKIMSVPPFCDMNAAERTQLLTQMEAAYKAGLPVVDEDSMPGELANVIAGRITNAFDLGGANFTVDAACASSMAAIQAAVKSLQDGESDVVLTGGADRSMNVATYIKFCKIGALSPDHSSPFDASANGFVMGEGCGILVLKRLEDAVRDNDRVYAVIRGIGASSDGKGKGITAPNLNGQVRALHRAYEAAGVDPGTVDLIEAHGTSTVVGDKVEVEALNAVIGAGRRGARGPLRIGSVKSMIGHLKSAAGAASVTKTALALYHGVLPPSLNFATGRPDVPFDVIPLRVQGEPEPWPDTADGLRRAGVSAFGFGGTNFHMVLESWGGQRLAQSVRKLPPAPQVVAPRPAAAAPPPRAPVAALPRVEVSTPSMRASATVPDGVWATSGMHTDELVANLEALQEGRAAPFHPSAPLRVAGAPADAEERSEQLTRAIAGLKKGTNPDLLRARGIAIEDVPFDRKLVFLFTGQGSQYLDMGLDLAAKYPVIADTFAEADRIIAPELGRPISDFIRLNPGEDADAKDEILRQTEYSQPATLTMDVALMRLLVAYGAVPDMVAGHSLGEYGAAVAAGVMTFEQSLYAVTARGREMASIQLADSGKMAGIATSAEVVEEVLAEVDGYVIAANKNCPTQTVIAGASDAVEEACERFKARNITVYPLPVSHAFHSAIVAPASDPLRGVLRKLGLKAPRRPITTNVTGDYYPTGDGAVEKIIELLAQQISAPVEWTAQMERMYEDDGRVFVEIGPKRALSGFTVSILKRRPHRALYTNHPKRGGVESFRDALAQLMVLGVPVRGTPLATAQIDLFATPEARRATTDALNAHTEISIHQTETAPDLREGVLKIVAQATGYEPGELDLDHELEADLGIDTVKQAEVFSTIRDTYGIPTDPSFSFSDHKTLRSLIEWAGARTGSRVVTVTPEPTETTLQASTPTTAATPAMGSFLDQAGQLGLHGLDAEQFARAVLPAVQHLLTTAFEAAKHAKPASVPEPTPARAPVAAAVRLPGNRYAMNPTSKVVASGASIGLPGGDEVFGPDNFLSMLTGRNRISRIGDRAEKFLDLGLVRLVKDPQTGQGSFLPVQRTEEVIRLAGTEARFDLGDYGIDDEMIGALDVTTRLAFAAGLEALRDAGIPMVRAYKTAANGKKVPQGWSLPEALRDGTGVIFGAAFPGYDMFARHLSSGGRDANGRFDRRFLFQVLAMGHSQFAQLIGARGPNTQINAACASSTQALALADDWIRTGRCERVVVVGADDVTSDALLPWIGGGFMAAGAASTLDVVEDAALPFDRRRHGLILGMGAVGIVVETEEACRARGVVPLGTQLGVSIVNSAFHGTRLDVDHIAQVMRGIIDDVCRNEGITPADFAHRAFFMSHETYTPARGGSAAAEIEALRAAFGPAANQIVVTNTKGFTGHPMGAGIEDGVTLKALQYGIVPPVANLLEPDESLGDLTLSRGERRPFDYSVRLAAGFGSQLAITIYKREAHGDARVDLQQRAKWLREVTGWAHVEEKIEHRTLRAYQSEADRPYDLRPDVHIEATPRADVVAAPPRAPAPKPAAPPPAPAAPRPSAPAASSDGVLADLVQIVAVKTGYDAAEIEPDFELEADLGVDTVKQAEILSDITGRYGLERDEAFRIADYPSVRALAGYLTARIGGPAPAAGPVTPAAAAPADDIVRDLVAVVAEKTGYDPAELDPSFELEADLGIDTVKQAEILSDLTARYGLERDDSFRLADYPTITALAGYFAVRAGKPAAAPSTPAPSAPTPAAPSPPKAATGAGFEATLSELMDVVAEKTGYDLADLEPSFELEADLGVDTVKQAEILSALQDRYQLTRDDAFRPADHPTLEALARYLHARRGASGATSTAPAAIESAPAVLRPVSASVALPSSFRIRRVALEARASASAPPLAGRKVRILGAGELASALKAELVTRSAVVVDAGAAEMVIDAGDDVLHSFADAKALVGERPQRWIAATRIGGIGAPHAAEVGRAYVDGARAGFTKALVQEWRDAPGFAGAVVDLHPALSVRDAAARLCDELGAEDREVFYGADGARRVVVLTTEAAPPTRPWTGRPTIVLTGGGRGITAKVAQTLAQRGPVTLVLVGRSAIPEQPLDEKAAKDQIRADLQAAGERITPARVEAVLLNLRRADEARRNLQELRALGATVHYVRADLADPTAVRAAVTEIERLVGSADVLVHGAGTEESRQIQDKDEVAFRRVFDGKAIGGRIFIEAMGPSTYVVCMGSVAGRFGNPGQVDYAAANDALARMCHTRPGSLHVDWTAWDDVGMAVRGGMKSLLEGRGVDLLPADAGASLLADFVLTRTTGELIVAGELGDFEPANAGGGSEEIVFEGDAARLTRVFTRTSDPWLVDHSIDGVPVLPGVMGVELMTKAADALLARAGLTVAWRGARDVRFDAPVKVHRDEPTTVVVEARRVGEDKVATRLYSSRTLKTGRVQQLDHFSAVVDFGAREPLDALPSVFLPEEAVDRAGIYERFFHGPIFQVMRSIHGVSADGLAGEVAVDHGPLGEGLLTAPLVLEAAFQAAGLHRMIVRHEMGLPQRFDEVRLLSTPTAGEPLTVTVQLDGDQYHVDIDSERGPVLRLRGFAMIALGPMPPHKRFAEPASGRPTCFPTVVQLRARDGRAIEAVAREAKAHADEDSTAWLTDGERLELEGRGTDRRVRDRIAGRLAAKRALAALTGVDPLQIRVLTAPSGEPVAVVPGHPQARVSITHRDGRAIAVAVAEGRVGVDMERVEDRGERFATDWFAAEERDVLRTAEEFTIGWAIKEAVLKWLGTGLKHAPHDVRILAISPGRAEVELLGESAARYRALGADPLQVHWGSAGADEIVVTVRSAA